MLQHLYTLKKTLNEHHIFFCFVGPISQRLLTDMMSILEQKMSLEQASRTTIMRVFSVVVEKVQNIIHYSDERLGESGLEQQSQEAVFRQGIITVGHDGTHYFVLSGNVIENSRIDSLRKKLTGLQTMSKAELKSYYQELRKKDPEEGSKGAGLGFIEMAKKASRPIEFDFTPIDAATSFFSLKTVI